MMILHDINNNIQIFDTSFSGGYQYEYEILDLYQEIPLGGMGPKQKTADIAVHITHEIIKT